MSGATADGVRPGDAAGPDVVAPGPLTGPGSPSGSVVPGPAGGLRSPGSPGPGGFPLDGVVRREAGRLPAAVLWDMDGTLVDTEPYWIDCEFALVAEYGGTWSLEHAHALVGNSLLASGEYLRRHGGVDLPAAQVVDRLLDGVVARVREHIPWRPGAQELLDALAAAGVPCALVTMSYRRLAEAVLAALPPATFATVVAGDDVTHGKPHPEPYLTAAARLGVAARDCVAIEDSPTGIASAVAAGVPVLAVEHLVPLEPGPGRHRAVTLAGVTPAQLGQLWSLLGT